MAFQREKTLEKNIVYFSFQQCIAFAMIVRKLNDFFFFICIGGKETDLTKEKTAIKQIFFLFSLRVETEIVVNLCAIEMNSNKINYFVKSEQQQ